MLAIVDDLVDALAGLCAKPRAPWCAQATQIVARDQCAQVLNLDTAQIAALQWYGQLDLRPATEAAACAWLLTEPGANSEIASIRRPISMALHTSVQHPVANSEMFWIMKRR